MALNLQYRNETWPPPTLKGPKCTGATLSRSRTIPQLTETKGVSRPAKTATLTAALPRRTGRHRAGPHSYSNPQGSNDPITIANNGGYERQINRFSGSAPYPHQCINTRLTTTPAAMDAPCGNLNVLSFFTSNCSCVSQGARNDTSSRVRNPTFHNVERKRQSNPLAEQWFP